MNDFGLWMSLLLSHWQNWASGGGLGGVVILLVYLIERLRGKTMNNAWYIVLFVVVFILGASFMVWKDEHQQVTLLSVELEKQKSPRLDAQFDIFAATRAGENNESSIVFVTATITNMGAPSIVNNITLSIKVGDKQTEGQYFALPQNEIRLQDKTYDFTLKREDYLVKKCMSQPIPLGGAVQGGMPLFFPGIEKSKVFERGTVFIFSFQDISHKTYKFKKTMTGAITPPLNIKTLQKLGH